MAYDTFAPYKKKNGCFIVRNVTPDRNKTIRIFGNPILFNCTRDILAITGVAESDIRASLLKGELQHKILAKDIVVECSDIDLLQFNDEQKLFLQNAGIIKGLEVSAGSGMTDVQHETLRQLIHLADGVGGPMTGFASGAFRETLPLDDPFPTSITWWDSSSKSLKIVEKNLSYDANKRITVTVWKVYDEGGILLATVTDTFAYNGSSPFESSRTRVIT